MSQLLEARDRLSRALGRPKSPRSSARAGLQRDLGDAKVLHPRVPGGQHGGGEFTKSTARDRKQARELGAAPEPRAQLPAAPRELLHPPLPAKPPPMPATARERKLARQHAQDQADHTFERARSAGYSPESARELSNVVLAKLTPVAAPRPSSPPAPSAQRHRGRTLEKSRTDDLVDHPVHTRYVEPSPVGGEDDPLPHATLVPFSRGQGDGYHVYANRQHIGQVVNAGRLPTLSKRGGEYTPEGDTWRAQVPAYDERTIVDKWGHGKDEFGGEFMFPKESHDELVHTRARTIGFGGSPEEAADHFHDQGYVDDAHARHPGADLEPVAKVTPYNRGPRPEYQLHPDDEAELKDMLDEGMSFDEMAGDLGLRSRADRQELADMIRDLRRTGRWAPKRTAAEKRQLAHAKQQADLTFERARRKGIPRARAVAMRNAVYEKLAPPDPLELPPSTTPRYVEAAILEANLSKGWTTV